MSQDKRPLASRTTAKPRFITILKYLRDEVGFDKIKSGGCKIRLTARKIAAYYGCMLLRPGKVMGFDDAENPQIMEDFIKALGAEAVIYPSRNECCGGYVALEDAESARKKSNKVSESAKNHGADMIVTACPLCKYNLVKNGSELPVIYFTELLGRGARRKGGWRRCMNKTEREKEQILRISGVNPRKCMRCGKCSGTCPSYDEMEYHPHQFVYMVESGDIETLIKSDRQFISVLSCFACVDRCPRGVEPAKLIEALRLAVIREKGANHMTANDIPQLLDDEMPQQAIVSAMRKYSK